MPVTLEHAKLVAASGAAGEIWADDTGRFAFIPHNPALREELTRRRDELAVLMFEMLEEHFPTNRRTHKPRRRLIERSGARSSSLMPAAHLFPLRRRMREARRRPSARKTASATSERGARRGSGRRPHPPGRIRGLARPAPEPSPTRGPPSSSRASATSTSTPSTSSCPCGSDKTWRRAGVRRRPRVMRPTNVEVPDAREERVRSFIARMELGELSTASARRSRRRAAASPSGRPDSRLREPAK